MSGGKDKSIEEEIIEEEIAHFIREKERIREIIGRIGGKPTIGVRIVNIVIFILVIGCFIMSLVLHGKFVIFSIELGVLLLSIKLALFLNNQAKMNHFQFWILSSLEWRLNEIYKILKERERSNKKWQKKIQ